EHGGVEETLEARAWAPLAALVGAHAPRRAAGEAALVRKQALRGALRRQHRGLAVLDLHLVRPLALVVPAPTGAEDAGGVGAPRQVQARARVRFVGEAGVVPTQAALERQAAPRAQAAAGEDGNLLELEVVLEARVTPGRRRAGQLGREVDAVGAVVDRRVDLPPLGAAVERPTGGGRRPAPGRLAAGEDRGAVVVEVEARRALLRPLCEALALEQRDPRHRLDE